MGRRPAKEGAKKMKPLTCLALAVAYTLSPVDLSIFYAPDLVPVYGQTVGAVDDVLFDVAMLYLAFRRKGKR